MVKNESKYIKQVLRSILPYVDKGIIVDTGSTDDTVQIVFDELKEYPNIDFEGRPVDGDSINWNGNHLSQQLTAIRNIMLERTKTKWVFQVDGDEIYTPAAISDLRLAMSLLEDGRYKGIQVPIRWCISDKQYVEPGPFPKTLRVMPSNGKWIGEFPNEFLYVDGVPMHMNDMRCCTTYNPFLHMSMALHPERRPTNCPPKNLTDEDYKLCSNIQ